MEPPFAVEKPHFTKTLLSYVHLSDITQGFHSHAFKSQNCLKLDNKHYVAKLPRNRLLFPRHLKVIHWLSIINSTAEKLKLMLPDVSMLLPSLSWQSDGFFRIRTKETKGIFYCFQSFIFKPQRSSLFALIMVDINIETSHNISFNFSTKVFE